MHPRKACRNQGATVTHSSSRAIEYNLSIRLGVRYLMHRTDGPSRHRNPGHRIQPEPPTRSQASSNLNFKFTYHASENRSHPILPGHSWPPSLSSRHGHPLAWPSSPSGVIRRPCPHRRGSAAHPHSSSRAIEYDLSIRLGVRLEFQVHLSSIRFAGPLYPPFQRYAVVIKIQSMGRAIRHSGCSLIVATSLIVALRLWLVTWTVTSDSESEVSSGRLSLRIPADCGKASAICRRPATMVRYAAIKGRLKEPLPMMPLPCSRRRSLSAHFQAAGRPSVAASMRPCEACRCRHGERRAIHAPAHGLPQSNDDMRRRCQ